MKNLTFAEAQLLFPLAMEHVNAEHALIDPHDCLYLNEKGVLIIGNHLDMLYDEWDPETGHWCESPDELERWSYVDND